MTKVLAVALISLWVDTASAQWHGDASHRSWPSDLDLQTVTGKVVVDTSFTPAVYYLDVDGDGGGEIRLAFGPPWYQPDNGETRTEPGSETTIVGLLVETGDLPTLVVFEIDGLSWRQPVEYGMHGWNEMGFWTPTDDTLTVTGTVLVDTTYFYRHLYLDTDNDSIPEYRLTFGPDWYEPVSGVERPDPGATVTVFGAVHETHGADRLVVYELDGVEWRALGEPAGWAGSWMPRDHADTTLAYCVNDSASWIAFPPGHIPGGMGQMHWPDSMFVQFWRIPRDSLPGDDHQVHFAGFYVDVHDPAGGGMMGDAFGGRQGMMSFARELKIRLHYHDGEFPGHSEDGIRALVWDEEMHEWNEVPNAIVDREANSVLVAGSDLGRYYVLANPEIATSIDDRAVEIPVSGVALLANYPNPFDGLTAIVYELPASRHVVLSVYDLVGRRVATLVDGVRPIGVHQVSFDGSGYPSGVYIYRIEAGGKSLTRQMILLD